MKHLIACFIAFLLCFSTSVASTRKMPDSPDEALRVLEREIAGYLASEQIRLSRIDSIKSDTSNSARKYLLLAEEYRKYDVDSALQYYRLAQSKSLTEQNDTLRVISGLRYASLLPVAGLLSDGEKIYASFRPDSLPASLRDDYYLAGSQLNFYAGVSNTNENKAYMQKTAVATDSLLGYLPPQTQDYQLYTAVRYMLRGDSALAIAEISDLMAGTDDSDETYAIAASMAAHYYSRNPAAIDRQIIFLALSAASDLRSGRREMTALQELGKVLYAQGDYERANRYLHLALDFALKSGSRLRIIESADIMPVISNAMQEKSDARNTRFIVVIFVLILIVAIFSWLLYNSYRKRVNLQNAHQNAVDSLDAHTRHIRDILTLCSQCLSSLDDFNLMAMRKLKANQVNELYDMLKDRKIVHEQIGKFLDTFDATFLSIYPDFIDEVNALLQPDKQLTLSSSHTLTPELRILAFMRLGIDDSGSIAGFLDLSVNTVYTYRNKMKNRAINRDKFESAIKISTQTKDGNA